MIVLVYFNSTVRVYQYIFEMCMLDDTHLGFDICMN